MNCGIRINICSTENKSKVVIYLQPQHPQKMSSPLTFYFIQDAKTKLDEIIQFIGDIYSKSAKAFDINYKIRIFNIGSKDAEIKRCLNEKKISNIVDNIETQSTFRRGFLDVVGFSEEKYFNTFSEYFKSFQFEHDWCLRKKIL